MANLSTACALNRSFFYLGKHRRHEQMAGHNLGCNQQWWCLLWRRTTTCARIQCTCDTLYVSQTIILQCITYIRIALYHSSFLHQSKSVQMPRDSGFKITVNHYCSCAFPSVFGYVWYLQFVHGVV